MTTMSSSAVLPGEATKTSNVSSATPPHASAFHSVASASSEGATRPPPASQKKTSPPGGQRPLSPVAVAMASSPTSSSDEDRASSSPARRRSRSKDSNNDDTEENILEDEKDHEPSLGRGTFDWPANSSYDERRNLLGTEEESSERPSSEDEDEERNPWNITKEQLNYYTTQFFSMQPNLRGVIPGELAKEFFEKSRLPITELRKIWQLSDVTKDGCLSIEEFLTAMHLVVLRRNQIELPDSLPSTLEPATLRNKVLSDVRHNKDLYGDEIRDSDHLLSNEENEDSHDGVDSQRREKNLSEVATPNSSVGEDGHSPPPANFDFRDARMNPRIIQPVPLRLSPESPAVAGTTSEDEDEGRNNKRTNHGPGLAAAPLNVKQNRREVIYEQLWNQDESSLLSAEESLSSLTIKGGDATTSVTSRTLEQEEKDPALSEENTTDEEELEEDETSARDDHSNVKHEEKRKMSNTFPNALQRSPPPPPPPRGAGARTKTHFRSSSLDLNVRGPPVPPRGATQLDSDTKIEEEGADKFPKDAKSLKMLIREYREKNSILARTINELHQEVSDILEERIALEYQLEQLKSFGDDE